MTDFQIVWRDQNGVQQDIISTIHGVDLAFGEMAIGTATVSLPSSLYNFKDFGRDHMLEIQRSFEGGKFKTVGDRCWFVRYRKQDAKKLTLKACDSNYLLGGRIIAYNSETPYSTKSGKADDVIKAIVRENLGSSATDTLRRIADFTVQADYSLGATVSNSFSRDKVLNTLVKIANESVQAGTYISFDVVYKGGTSFEFQTFKDQRGTARGKNAINPMIFSEAFGNLINSYIEEDLKDEVTYVYAGGSGEREARVIGTASSSAATLTRWSRRELFWDGKNSADPTVVNNEAKSQLYANRARKVFSGTVQETDSSRFDLDYGYGDIVLLDGYCYSAEARISTVHINANEEGEEKVDIKLRSEW